MQQNRYFCRQYHLIFCAIIFHISPSTFYGLRSLSSVEGPVPVSLSFVPRSWYSSLVTGHFYTSISSNFSILVLLTFSGLLSPVSSCWLPFSNRSSLPADRSTRFSGRRLGHLSLVSCSFPYFQIFKFLYITHLFRIPFSCLQSTVSRLQSAFSILLIPSLVPCPLFPITF